MTSLASPRAHGTDPGPLWSPPPDIRERSRIGHYLAELEATQGLRFDSYDQLWRWSVDHLEPFWSSVWDFFGVRVHSPYDRVLGDASMPGAVWFSGATLNYAEHAVEGALVGGNPDRPVVVAHSQTRGPVTMTAGELRDQVARARVGLRRLGVGPGDRVVGYLPNIPETVVVFLAAASLGAIWSSCAPEFGTRSVVDRFQQIEPKVLLAIDGYRYGDRDVDRTDEVAAIQSALGSLQATVSVPYLETGRTSGDLTWAELIADGGPLEFTPVPFNHPLYVLYSSGTTGLPKAIVHGHGGILVEHLKALGLHTDLGPDDRFFWFTTTGWMMWNYLVSGLLVGAAVVLFDGNPGHPDLMTLWRLVEETGMTYLGASAQWIMSCRKAGVEPARTNISSLRGVGSTGSPLPAEGFEWVYQEVAPAASPDGLLLGSVSGGTDVCTAFVGASPLVPVYAGEIPCRFLGARVEAFDPAGRSVVGEVGELVITAPMPSMPVGFWADPDGARYRAAYFEDYPGVWRHGDWITITERGSCIITGRSDATLNRGGVRLGTAEFYSAVEELNEVADSLVIHLDDPAGGMGELLLFVVLVPGVELDDELRLKIGVRLRSSLSPRHVPDAIYRVPAIPRTLSGKKLEVPVKRILMGIAPDQAASRGALADPDSLRPFEQLVRRSP